MKLRSYQADAVNALLAYNGDGGALVVMPTGSGKTLVIAEVARRLIASGVAPADIAVLTHYAQLATQNAAQLPTGVACGTIQHYAGASTRNGRLHLVSRWRYIIVDEAHGVSDDNLTMYRRVIMQAAPGCRVFGLTATPFRLDSGMLTDQECGVFREIVYTADVGQLVRDGYLCPLVTVDHALPCEGLNEFANVVDDALDDAMPRLAGRRSVLVFAPTIADADTARAGLLARGVKAECVHSGMSAAHVKSCLSRFKAGKLRYLVSIDQISTGFDAPRVDAIVMLRRTESPGRHAQMLGRGMRVHKDKSDCLVLDYTPNTATHGPIDAVTPPKATAALVIDGTGGAVMRGPRLSGGSARNPKLYNKAQLAPAMRAFTDAELAAARDAMEARQAAQKERKRERERARKAGPAYKERAREWDRERDRVRKADPAYKERQREHARARRADPAYKERARDYARAYKARKKQATPV